MPKRPTLGERVAADTSRGRHAFDPRPDVESAPADRTDPAPARRLSWEERHRRVIFHCPIDLLEDLEAEMKRSDRSKSQVLTEALREHLRNDRTRREG